ncbi:MAG TPA: hypothetical protein VGJ60_34020 [Chloroflexota bacterium]|jgi:hypothetical protein
MTEQGRMTARERSELGALLRRRAKVARAAVAHVKAERLADFEAQLASEFAAEDERFRDLVRYASEAAQRADGELQLRCQEMGIPERFRPSLRVSWSSRGENALAERRAELRRVAQTRADADAKAAIEHIEASAVRAEEDLLREGLSTGAAHAVLERLPTPEALMPPLEVRGLLQALPGHHFDQPASEAYGRYAFRMEWKGDAKALDELLRQRLGAGVLMPAMGSDDDDLTDGDQP